MVIGVLSVSLVPLGTNLETSEIYRQVAWQFDWGYLAMQNHTVILCRIFFKKKNGGQNIESYNWIQSNLINFWLPFLIDICRRDSAKGRPARAYCHRSQMAVGGDSYCSIPCVWLCQAQTGSGEVNCLFFPGLGVRFVSVSVYFEFFLLMCSLY